MYIHHKTWCVQPHASIDASMSMYIGNSLELKIRSSCPMVEHVHVVTCTHALHMALYHS